MHDGGGHFQPGHDNKSLARRPQKKARRQNPDVNIPPSAHEPDHAFEGAKFIDYFSAGEINASFGHQIGRLSYQE